MDYLPKIAITMGDPAGIGPEIIVKGLRNLPADCHCLVIGDAEILKTAVASYASDLKIVSVQQAKDADFAGDSLYVLDLANVEKGLPQGAPSPQGGKAALEYIQRAVELAMRNEVDAIVTAPINKESIHLAGCPFPGHTELLADLTGATDVALLMQGGNLRIVLATTHVALSEVKDMITKDRILKTIRLTHHWLTRFVKDRPKIAVTALNPHCGEGGIFGDEEQRVILPAIDDARRENIDASGPWSADSLFSRIGQTDYDAVAAMYHDQGMIPVKMASGGCAVNITLGLPIIRTSVDHGTAYDIVGKGLASPDSLIEALKTAVNLSRKSLAIK